jgi:hypothetical protein
MMTPGKAYRQKGDLPPLVSTLLLSPGVLTAPLERNAEDAENAERK